MKLHDQKCSDDHHYNKYNGYGRRGINFYSEDDLRERRKTMYRSVLKNQRNKKLHVRIEKWIYRMIIKILGS